MSAFVLLHEGIELLGDSHHGEERAFVRVLEIRNFHGIVFGEKMKERKSKVAQWLQGEGVLSHQGGVHNVVHDMMSGEVPDQSLAHCTTLEPTRKVKIK